MGCIPVFLHGFAGLYSYEVSWWILRVTLSIFSVTSPLHHTNIEEFATIAEHYCHSYY